MLLLKKKVCLFTAHSPLTGGGGAILRSLVPNLSGVSICWKYTASRVAQGYEDGFLGRSLIGTNDIIRDVWNTLNILSNRKSKQLTEIVKQLLELDCDQYWIVSHNEGLRVAIELMRLQNKRPVHLTVHDDWAAALCARSSRYFLMAPFANRLTKKALVLVSGFDVISKGMQDYYMQLAGKKGFICHRYIPESSLRSSDRQLSVIDSTISIGHIGSVYSKKDFISFLMLMKGYCKSKNCSFLVKLWGCHLTLADIPQELKTSVEFHKSLPEEKIIPFLLTCHFVYSMYPTSKQLYTFSKTSLPTKLTTYIQCCRPIFGQGPGDSTLSDFIATTGIGVSWNGKLNEDGHRAVDEIMNMNVELDHFKKARSRYFGENNLQLLSDAFA